MPERQNGETDPRRDWFAQTLRFTVFTRAPLDASEQLVWWEQMIGEPADDVITKPREGSGRARGAWKEGMLVLAIGPSRIDWLWEPKETPGSVEVPLIGSFSECVAEFQNLMLAWMPECPQVARVGFGAGLILPTEGRVSGYQTLAGFLPSVEIDPENSSDLVYRINRRRPSKSGVEGLVLNRLSTWSVVRIQSYAGQLALGGSSDVGHLSEVGSRYACKLDVDINTIPEFQGDISAEDLPGIYQELVSLGIEISERGDVS